jgi:hypothetical protein
MHFCYNATSGITLSCTAILRLHSDMTRGERAGLDEGARVLPVP